MNWVAAKEYHRQDSVLIQFDCPDRIAALRRYVTIPYTSSEGMTGLDPPGTHPSPTFSEGTTGGLRD